MTARERAEVRWYTPPARTARTLDELAPVVVPQPAPGWATVVWFAIGFAALLVAEILWSAP